MKLFYDHLIVRMSTFWLMKKPLLRFAPVFAISLVLLSLGLLFSPISAQHPNDNIFVEDDFGSSFTLPSGIVVNSTGHIFVVDNGKVQVFDSNFLNTATITDSLITAWDVDVDDSGNIYVTDITNNQIQVFDSSRILINSFGSQGTADGQFDFPNGIAYDDVNDRIIVTDRENFRIQIFDSSGGLKVMFGFGVDDGTAVAQTCTSSCQAGISGTGNGQLGGAIGVDVDSAGNIIVADTFNDRIQVFTRTGVDTYAHDLTFGSSGSGPGQFNAVADVSVDSFGNIIAADFFNNRIQLFDKDGNFIDEIGTSGSSIGAPGSVTTDFSNPIGVDFDDSNRIFVAQQGGNLRVQILNHNAIPTIPLVFPLTEIQSKLTALDGTTDDDFSFSMAVSGDTAVVGAQNDDDLGTDSGSAYVFIKSGNTWMQQAKLTALDGAAEHTH